MVAHRTKNGQNSLATIENSPTEFQHAASTNQSLHRRNWKPRPWRRRNALFSELEKQSTACCHSSNEVKFVCRYRTLDLYKSVSTVAELMSFGVRTFGVDGHVYRRACLSPSATYHCCDIFKTSEDISVCVAAGRVTRQLVPIN